MSRRGRWVALGGGALVAALLLGRVAVGILADRWWAASVDPGFAAPVTRLHLLRTGLEAAAIGVAAGWFTLHLLLVVRAVHRVEIPRYLGNLEFRESVRRRTLLWLAAGAGLLLGILAGYGASAAWQPLALWLGGGVRYGIADPVLGRDLGTYVADLPALAWLQGFTVRLALLGLSATAVAYALVGAVRWTEGRLAASDHARRHLALLLVLLALALGWGHFLDPARWLAAPEGAHAGSMTWRIVGLGSSAMLGVALGTAAISAAWARSARPLLVGASWIVFLVASLGIRGLLPAATDPGPPLVDDATRRGLDAVAWGLADLERPALPAAPERPGLWHPAAIAQAASQAPAELGAVAPGVVHAGGMTRPVWFALRLADSGASLAAIADDRVAPGGGTLSYRPGDSLAYPGVVAWSPAGRFHPGAWGVARDPAAGVPLGGPLRRTIIAWALQRPGLLGGGRAQWHRSPVERLGVLAPWAQWGPAVPMEIDGVLWWVSPGLIALPSFAGTTRAPAGEGEAGGIEHALVGLVRADDGRARLVLAPAAGPVAARLAGIAAPLVEPAESLPPSLRASLPYPGALFESQALVVGRGPWSAGRLTAPGLSGVTLVRDAAGRPFPSAAFEDSAGRRVAGLLLGLTEAGRARPVLLRAGEGALPSPATLVARWSRFPVWEQLRDSAEAAGARVEPGPVRYQFRGPELAAWQPQFATGPGRRPVLLWVSLALGDRLGAGRGFEEAWRNLGGLDAPLPPGLGGTRLDEARRWMARADSALRTGDWAAFGRAFEALRTILVPLAADSGP